MHKQIAVLGFLLIVAPLIVAGQSRNVALLAAECVSVGRGCEDYRLVRLHFRDGLLVSKDTILTTKYTQVRYDLGKNHIYRNRYVITNWGDVVDIQNKKLLHDGIGDYVGIEGDRVIQHVKRADDGGYFYYDLNRNRYQRILVPTKWEMPGMLSPDETKSVEGEGNRIWLRRLNGERKLLGSGFDGRAQPEVSFVAAPPLLWLDNTRILSQTGNGEIVVVRLDGTVIPVVNIPVSLTNYTKPDFFRNVDNKIVYTCCDKSYVIDVEGKSWAPYEWLALGFGFDAEYETNRSYGHIIRYQGKEIGRLWASVWDASAFDGYVAFEYGDVGSNLGYPKGIKVWSSATRKWTTINEKSGLKIIGWVAE